MKITHCKLNKSTQKKLLEYFVLEVTARSTADMLGIQATTVILFYRKICQVICHHLMLEADALFEGSVELDESYFGGKRKGKRGRRAAGKVVVFGILKRGDKVYTEIVPDASKATLQKVIRGRISIESVINTDGWRGYQGLVDMGFVKHFRVHHGDDEFARSTQHINGIESFWSYAKHRLVQFSRYQSIRFTYI